MQITDGHMVALLRSEMDRVSLFSDFLQYSQKVNHAVILLLADTDPNRLPIAFGEHGSLHRDLFDPEKISIYPVDTLLLNGAWVPGSALDWMNRERRLKATEGYSSVCFAIEMSKEVERISDDRALLVFESALEELCAESKCSAVTFYTIEGDRGRLTDILRAPKQIWLDQESLINPYYTPAKDLFSPGSKSTLFNQMLENIETKRDRDTLVDSEDLLRALFREIDVGFALFDARDSGKETGFDFYVLQTNPALEEINGAEPGKMVGKNAALFFPTDDPEVIDIFCETAACGVSARFERYKEDIHRYFEIIAFRPKQGLCAALVTDITERKRLEENKQKSEFRIRQTQKMEAIGRLASGVAHDFNNILTAIVGLANVLMEELPDESSQWSDVEEIKKAADRAATLTRQLLAFSRKQEVSPKVVNLNRIIEDSHKMLSRIIGEDIRLTFIPGEHLNPIKIDPGHMEQVLANFAANSRDAMPQGGELIIETKNVSIREHHISVHGDLMPGNYVLLSARDTGVGMSETVQERIFEPFFTTKEKGKGTGLGLATVYGIVRQNQGIIAVRSAVGCGTTFDLYFPWADSAITEIPVSSVSSSIPSSATVLLAEDEETVRNLTTRILERNGYHVIAAASGEDAVKIWPTLLHRVDFLLTDVVMPGMNGVELYKRLKKDKPELKVLYISGYPEDVIAGQGASSEQVQLLEKPFSPMRLISKIQEIMTEA